MPSSTSLADWNRLAARRLERLVERARGFRELRARGPSGEWRVSVRVVGAGWMRRLNRDFRGKDRVTDVLSFPAPEIFAEAQGWLGELVICAPVLRRQAAAAGGAERGELDLLLVHGLLHLLGLDHERGPAEAREMGEWESRVLGRRGGLVARGSREGLAAKGSRKRFREGTS